MVFTPSTTCYLLSALLFLLAALPPVAHYPLLALGLLFLAIGHVLS